MKRAPAATTYSANRPDSTLVLVRDRWLGLFNSPLMAAPGHAMIGDAFRRATETILSAGHGTLPIWETAGTGLLRQVFVEWVLDGGDTQPASTMLVSEWDSVRFSRDEHLAYKTDTRRNWRIP